MSGVRNSLAAEPPPDPSPLARRAWRVVRAAATPACRARDSCYALAMADERALAAISRIERALARIEAASVAGRPPAADPDELRRSATSHHALRAKVEGAIAQIDRLLEAEARLMANDRHRDRRAAAITSPAATARRSISARSRPMVDRQGPGGRRGARQPQRDPPVAVRRLAPRRRASRSIAPAPASPPVPPPPDPASAQALERLAERVEALADRLERSACKTLDRV